MASVTKEFDVPATPDAVWEALTDFGAVHERVAAGFVVSSVLDGDVRTVQFMTGAVARERLIGVDDERRRLVYSVIDSPFAMEHHQATVVVSARDDGSSGARLAWTTDVLPDDVAPLIDQMMTAGATAMTRTLAG